MKRLYIRCNDSHYFTGQSCPFDGWGSSETAKAQELAKGVDPCDLTMDHIRSWGLSEDLIKRVLIIEFGDESAAFQGLAPEYYFIKGEVVHRNDVDKELL